jgi:hypothetical protein
MHIKFAIGLLILFLNGFANADTCQQHIVDANKSWQAELDEPYRKEFTAQQVQESKDALNIARSKIERELTVRTRKLNSLTEAQIPDFLEEFNLWVVDDIWNSGGAFDMIAYLECKAGERVSFLKRQGNRNPQSKKPQTISEGPVSVSLIPNNNPTGKCYAIQFENRGNKNIDFFFKLKLINNKTGESGTSEWIGSNSQFDGLFGSANGNRLSPNTNHTMGQSFDYWLLDAKVNAFRNAPSNLYGFSDVVESCDDVTAEIPVGGFRWNENAYQRHSDACSSPIKRNRPVGC